MRLGQPEVFLLGKLEHGALCQLVERSLADESFLACVLSEEEVKDDAQQGKEPQHEHPRHRLRRFAVVHDDAHHHTYDDDSINDKPYFA